MLSLQSLFGVMIKLGDIYYSGLHIILLLYGVSEIIMAMEIVAEPDTNYSMTLNLKRTTQKITSITIRLQNSCQA